VSDSGPPSFAVLCSADRTYQIRQQQTSNSLYVVSPRTARLDDESTRPGISAIASCSATLELSRSKDSADPYLRELIKQWDGENIDEMQIDRPSKQDVCSNIPLSRAEIDKDWSCLCAFEHSNTCYIPTNVYLLTAWKSILAAALSENIDMTNSAQDDILLQLATEDGIPIGLSLAILSRSREPDASIWVAKLLLESLNGEVHSRQGFLDKLKDNLPRNMTPPESLAVFQVCHLILDIR
jgi:sister chromatid cohesion protein DCC1